LAEAALEHEALGRLVYEAAYDCWAGQVELRPGVQICFSLSARTGAVPAVEARELLRQGADFLAWARRNEAAVRDRIAADLLEVYNDTWSAPDDGGLGVMSRDEFLGQVAPDAVDVQPDGSAYWYHGDGDLFGGHVIEVRIGPNREITEGCLAG
jgi:hypothetical protein